MIRLVRISKPAAKELQKAPECVQIKFAFWVQEIIEKGLLEVRKNPGWHDEPLKGQRSGQRSVRLSKKWRAIYVEINDDFIEFILVEEVMPHDY